VAGLSVSVPILPDGPPLLILTAETPYYCGADDDMIGLPAMDRRGVRWPIRPTATPVDGHSRVRRVVLRSLIVLGWAALETGNAADLTILEAVQSTVSNHPLVKAGEEDVQVSRARKMQASGAFDLQLDGTGTQSRTYTPLTDYEHLEALAADIDTFSQTQDATTLSGGAQMLLRSGIRIEDTEQLTRLDDNLTNLGGINQAQQSFEIILPLRRGKGREVVTAPERSAQMGVDAAVYELDETIAGLVSATVGGYWEYVAALRSLEIHRESERRAVEFVDSVRTLIQADRMPASELHQAVANLAAQAAARISAAQQVAQARQNLGLAMGIGALDALAISDAADPFPDGSQDLAEYTSPARVRTYIEKALQLRQGYLATRKLTEAADLTRTATRNRLLPQMDLIVTGGYSGLYSGQRPDEFLHSLFGRVGGPDLSAGLRYAFAPSNHVAFGQVAEAEANYRKSLLLSSEAAREIASAVAVALSQVEASARGLKKARESAANYELALEGERDKLRLGVGALVDLITVESRLTAAQLELVGAERDYAVALVSLRFATGTLLGPDPMHPAVDRDVFYHAPPAPGGE